MATEVNTIYKLIILYMLNKINFPMSNTQISEFILGKEYTNYFNLQQIISELIESEFLKITENTQKATIYEITPQGKETLNYFSGKLSNSIKEDINAYLAENKYDIKKESSISADYYKSTSGDYIVHCIIREGSSILIELNLSCPSEEQAEIMCSKWRDASENIYVHAMKALL
ncbi:MAG: DUF4364 family protein [Lachnospiraceae bacterium]|nr:DUF4364 family protein [Lachnospiraceae bacterium]